MRLRPTMQSDLDYVLSLERDPENLPYITPWEKIQHEARSASRTSATSSSRPAPSWNAAAS